MLAEWRGRHRGDTVWVVGSSSAWDHLDSAFFVGKVCVAINHVALRFGLHDAYTVTQYWQDEKLLRDEGWDGWVFAPHETSEYGQPEPDVDRHPRTVTLKLPPRNRDLEPFPQHGWPDDDSRLLWGYTTLHPAMYLAWFMGAASIVTVAADHGVWNDKVNGDGYYKDGVQTQQHLFDMWAKRTDALAAELRRQGTNVYSLIPAVNLNLEGLSFKGPRATIG